MQITWQILGYHGKPQWENCYTDPWGSRARSSIWSRKLYAFCKTTSGTLLGPCTQGTPALLCHGTIYPESPTSMTQFYETHQLAMLGGPARIQLNESDTSSFKHKQYQKSQAFADSPNFLSSATIAQAPFPQHIPLAT